MPAASQEDVARVAGYAAAVLDLAGPDEQFYQSLPLCVLDAVFSINAVYQGVRNVIARYCAEASIRQFRDGLALLPQPEQESISCFCDRLEGWGTPDDVAARLGNRQRTLTPPPPSILKSEAAQRFADTLRGHGIEFMQDMAELSPQLETAIESTIRTIPGQGSGLTWDYFRMLSGERGSGQGGSHGAAVRRDGDWPPGQSRAGQLAGSQCSDRPAEQVPPHDAAAARRRNLVLPAHSESRATRERH